MGGNVPSDAPGRGLFPSYDYDGGRTYKPMAMARDPRCDGYATWWKDHRRDRYRTSGEAIAAARAWIDGRSFSRVRFRLRRGWTGFRGTGP